MNSLDPQTTSDGKPYGPLRYKEIVRERWIITKQCNMGYVDTAAMTPTERNYVLEFIAEDIKRTNEAIEKRKQEIAAMRNQN